MTEVFNSAARGIRDGLPIGIGYLSVSFTFGMMAVAGGLPVWLAVLISMSNVTSAGQFAGLSMIFSGGGLLEMAAAQLIINLRYSLMSLSLSQRLDKSVKIRDRLLMAFMNTDEIFAVATTKDGTIGRRYFYGLMLMPYLGWSAGTLLGALASTLLPEIVTTSLTVAIYGMFIAIIVPPAKKSFPILLAILISAAIACILYYVPLFGFISGGFSVIICAVTASAVCALIFPNGGLRK